DGARARLRHVAHDEKSRLQPAARVGEREIALVLAHGEHEALLGNREKFLVERSLQDLRPLDQRRDFVEQRVVGKQLRAPGLLLERLADALPALVEACDDAAVALEDRLVLARIAYGDLALAQETVAARASRPAGEAEHRLRQLQRFRSVHEQQAVRRPDELRVARAPAHGPGNRELLQRFVQHAGEDRVQPGARGVDTGHVYGAFRRLALPEIGNRQPVLLGESGDGLRRCLQRRAVHVARAVRGDGAYLGNQGREAAWSGKDLAPRIPLRQAVPLQAVADLLGENAPQAGERLRRQLFGEQFDQ